MEWFSAFIIPTLEDEIREDGLPKESDMVEPGTRNPEPGTRNPEPGTRTWNAEKISYNILLVDFSTHSTTSWSTDVFCSKDRWSRWGSPTTLT